MKTCFFTIYDKNNERFAVGMRNSLKKFHPDIPLIEFTDKDIDETGITRPHIFYMSAPYFAHKLMKEGYDQVIKLDADQIITGSLDNVINDTTYEVGVVNNFNKIDQKLYGNIGVWDIPPQEYRNNGFVALRSKYFVDLWLRICMSPRINNYIYREQDILNILCVYSSFKVLTLDQGPFWYGLGGKDEWVNSKMDKDNIVTPSGKTIKVIHFAGGNDVNKRNYRTLFPEEVIKRLDYLTHE